jgi:hypothetical protein
MSLPIDKTYTDILDKEVLPFLWTRQQDGQTVQKRRLVAKKRLAAVLEMGGLGIQSLEHTVQGFQQNLTQKIYKRGRQANTDSMLHNILDRLISRMNRPTLED